MHPREPDGSGLDCKSNSSDGSWDPGRDARPDTPLADTPKSEAKEARKLRWEPPHLSGDDKKSRWGPSTSVRGNNDYPSSVLDKDSYLQVYCPYGLVLTLSDDLRASDTTLRHSM